MKLRTKWGGETAPRRIFGRRTAALAAALGLFGAISAIASVSSVTAPPAEEDISQQILLIHDQEVNSRAAQRSATLMVPQAGFPRARTDFEVASNPVLLSELRQMERAQHMNGRLNSTTLSMIRDVAAVADAPEMPHVAPLAAELPKRRGQAQWHCLAEAIYFEARSESLIAQRAVAEVIMNRVSSKRYPNTVCEVVNQGAERRHRCQFSYNCDGLPETIHDRSSWRMAKSIAQNMVAAKERPLTKGATHYHTTSVRPFWSRSLERTSQYGAHIFYKRPTEVSRR